MKSKDIYEVREAVESIVCSLVDSPSATGYRRPRVIVTVNPLNKLDVTVISPLFEGKSFDGREAIVWPALEAKMTVSELERIDCWDLLTYHEAKPFTPPS